MLTFFLLWFPIVLIAFANGALREMVYKKWVGELAAHQVSTIIMLLLFSLYAYFIFQRFPPESGRQALLIGLLWLVMTIAFEFGLGRMRGYSWPKLLNDYNIMKGRVWIFIPLWVMLAPYVFYKWLV